MIQLLIIILSAPIVMAQSSNDLLTFNINNFTLFRDQHNHSLQYGKDERLIIPLGWLIPPDEINWDEIKALSFFVYGQGSGVRIVCDIRDRDKEMWRVIFEDDLEAEWKQVICPLDEFFARSDWQPSDAVKNGVLDKPVMVFQFQVLTPSEGTIYIDHVELLTHNVDVISSE